MPPCLFFFPESPTTSVLDDMGGLRWLLDRIYFHVQNDGRSFNNEAYSECPSRGRRHSGSIKVIGPDTSDLIKDKLSNVIDHGMKMIELRN
ncbi:hypothetical protein CDAR_605261 [Caerostris darwini]|uniref:Uncharacterized protein n=1 Tax=Caerostris darwini TaxID=1538125 RepID=A0AAV4U8U5_9ARAC|nr:hypothetical protein CDAR_605261 [Caerostris darwini]